MNPPKKTPNRFNQHFGLLDHRVTWPVLLSLLPDGDARLVALLIGEGYSDAQIETRLRGLTTDHHQARLLRFSAEEEIRCELRRHGFVIQVDATLP